MAPTSPPSAAPSDREIAERIFPCTCYEPDGDKHEAYCDVWKWPKIIAALAAKGIATERATVERLGDKYALVVANAERYMRAIKTLAQFKNGKTLFEGSPTQDQDCYQAWRELNDSGVALTTAIRQLSPPDPAPEPTQETER